MICNKILSLILFLYFLAGNHHELTANDSVFIEFTYPKSNTGSLDIFIPKDPLNNRKEKKSFTLPLNCTLSVALPIQSIRNLQIVYQQKKFYLLVKPSKDTFKISIDEKNQEWKIIHEPDQLNKETGEIEDFIDKCIFSVARPGHPGAYSIGKKYADSLKLKYAEGKYAREINDYARFSSLYLEAFFGKKINEDFISKAFIGSSENLYNPSWQNLFHICFDDWFINDFRSAHKDKWLKNLKSNHALDSIIVYIKNSTGSNDETLTSLILIKGIIDIVSAESINKNDWLNLTKDLTEKGLETGLNELIDFIEKRIRYASRGTDLPEISCHDAISNRTIQFNKMKGKPGYLLYLPYEEENTLKTLSYLDALDKKYGKTMFFLALIDIENEPKLRAITLKKPYVLFFSKNSSCSQFVDNFFETTERSSFILFDKNFKIWQSPAEGPETNVEASFLRLIKK